MNSNNPSLNTDPGSHEGIKGIFRKPDWWMVGLTLLIFATGCIGAYIFYHQFQEMHKQTTEIERQIKVDQRPWISVTTTGPPEVTEGEPLKWPIRIAVLGKTPAENIQVKVFVEEHSRLEAVKFAGRKAGWSDDYGSMFPNTTRDVTIARYIPEKLSHQEASDFEESKAYIAVFGTATYGDSLGGNHWTKFCYWYAEPGGEVNAEDCAEYNSVDSN